MKTGEGRRENEGWQKRMWLRLLVEKAPFFGLAAAVSVITFLVQRESHAVVDYLPFSARAANAVVSYGGYLAKTIWPTHLAVFYPHPAMNYLGSRSWPAREVAAAAIVFAALSFVAWRWRSERPWFLTGWLWYVGTLVPVIGLIQVGGQAFADRYTYIPLVGILVITSWGGALVARAAIRDQTACFAGIGLLMAACALATRQQVSHWRNTQTLFEHAVSVTQSNAVAHVVLGEELMGQRKTGQALEQFNLALKINPTLADTHFDLGNAHETAGEIEAAIQEYQTALAYRPWYDLARKRLAAQLLKAGRKEEALAQCRETVRRNPNDPEAHINYGGLLWQTARRMEAISEYQEALRLDSGQAVAHYDLGLAYASQGRPEEAAAEYSEAVRLNHDYAEALAALGRTLTLLGRLAEAPTPFRQLARLQPTNADFQINLGNALFMANRTNEAAEAFAAALRVQPNLPHELVQKATALLKQGQRDAAIARATTALRVQPNFPEARAFLESVSEQATPKP